MSAFKARPHTTKIDKPGPDTPASSGKDPQRLLAEGRINLEVERVVAFAPPLTAEQKSLLATLLQGSTGAQR